MISLELWLKPRDARVAAQLPSPHPPTDAERSTAERDLRWLVACGASDPNSRLYALGGHAEILFMICELACVGGMAKWAPLRTARPQTETLRHLYFTHAELVAVREQLAARDALISELQTEAERAARREANAVRLAEEAQQATQRVRDDEGDPRRLHR